MLQPSNNSAVSGKNRVHAAQSRSEMRWLLGLEYLALDRQDNLLESPQSSEDHDDWTDSATSNFKAFESGAWPKPDAAVFNYWTQPRMRVLPGNDPTTITGPVAEYIRWREAQGRSVCLK